MILKYKMNSMNKKFNECILKLLPLIILLLLILHLLKIDTIRIDNTAILLIVLLFISPLIPFLKKIKWGELEAEISREEIEQTKKKVEKIAKPEDIPTNRIIDHIAKDIYSTFEADYIMGLVKLRIEIEKLLKKIIGIEKVRIGNKPFGVDHLLDIVRDEKLVDMSYIEPLAKIIRLSDRAVHGENVEQDTALSIVDTALDLLKALYFEYIKTIIEPVEEKEITLQKLDEYSEAKYEVATIIPYAEKPVMKKYIVNQERLDIILDNYHEYAEFLISIKKLKKKR